MTTEILGITEVSSADADKFSIHNQALRELEAKGVRVISRTNGGPPGGGGSDGDVYIVDSATGVWSAFAANDLAHKYGGAWVNYTPLEGWRVWVNDEDKEVIFDGTDWDISNINTGQGTYSFALTDNTANAFDIKEGSNEYLSIDTTDSSELITFGNATTNPDFIFAGSGNVSIGAGASPASLLTLANTTNDYTGGIRIIDSGGTNYWGMTAVNGKLFFGYNSADSVVIDSGANIGINNNAPSTVAGVDKVLHLIGAGNGTSLRLEKSSGTTSDWELIAAAGQFQIFDADAVATRFTIDSSGNVGIGTSSPNALLEVSADSPYMYINDADSTGNAHLGYIAYTDSSDTEQAFFGFASATNQHFYLTNKYASGDIIVSTNTTEAVRIDSSQDVTLAGGMYIGGTTSANYFDDYEEGTWTPTIQDGSFSDAEGQTYSVQVGTYTKKGDEVHVQGQITISSLGTLTTSDVTHIAGLPFTSSSTSGNYAAVTIGYARNMSITAGHSMNGYIDINTTRIVLELWDSTGGSSPLLLSELTGSGALMFSATYKV